VCEGGGGARHPFYRRGRATGGRLAVAPANHGARAGVIAWGRDDVGLLASAGRGIEGACVVTRQREGNEATGAPCVCARAGRVSRACTSLDRWPPGVWAGARFWARGERQGKTREVQGRWVAGQFEVGLSGGA
jgi:hypothetical protein